MHINKKNSDFIIIPLTSPNVKPAFTKKDRIWICGLGAINKLLDYDVTELDDLFYKYVVKEGKPFPIQNKRIAISNILNFLSYVDFLRVINQSDTFDLHVKIIHKYFSTNTCYQDYMRILDELKIITNILPYEKDKKARTYVVYNEYKQDTPCIIILKNGQNKIEIENFSDIDIDTRFKDTIKNLQVDYKRAFLDELNHHLKEVTPVNEFRMRLNILFSLNNGYRFIKFGVKSNRLYHSFSCLSRISRKHIFIKGYTFNSIDIKNCQPLILVYYLKENSMSVDSQYQKDCEDAIFYEHFYPLVKAKNNNISNIISDEEKSKKLEDIRKIAKENLYAAVFFGFKINSKYNKKFKELYPKTYSSVEKIHAEKKKSLAAKLQNIEAEIFNHTIPPLSDYFFTLFDCIYFTNKQDVDFLENELSEKFQKLGIAAKMKIEP